MSTTKKTGKKGLAALIDHPAKKNTVKKKSSGDDRGQLQQQRTGKKEPAPRIELREMTKPELSGIEFLKKHTRKNTAAGAIKQMLGSVELVIKERDNLREKLHRLENQLRDIIEASENVQAAKEELARCMGRIETKPYGRPSAMDEDEDEYFNED